MVKSMNTKVDLTANATSFVGLGSYGKVMVGDKAFEFYNDRKVEDYVQIPWAQVDYVLVSVLFGGKRIPRFALRTKQGVAYSFATKDPKKVLRAIRVYVAPDHIVKSLSAFEVLRNGLAHLTHRGGNN
ncbi:DUF956 family protein [Lacticaseibacillus pabuli]|uniref:DUF956 family protein n=1 Tax=Lacticaseibacillus pabuli TaxID=3025672 RepID=A0ABY7WU99_9LACO|nr:DUF956 family protein [Lacticaseibacillus sp. KACC 23028]WDF82730.1 DUF956 family protein [Lacticaseibacillus sp. KACC 23028]